MAFCTKCGTESSPGQRFCVVCGSPLPVEPVTPATADSPDSPESPRAPSGATAWTPAPPLSAQDVQHLVSSHVHVGFASEPPLQGRLTILLRVVMAIPLLIWSTMLSVAALVAVVLSWFAALVTGRVPAGLQEFNTSVLRYVTEVQAYASVLVARWPGFSLSPGPTPQVSLRITPFPLNRAAVLFRYFLMLPASVVLFAVDFASYLLSVAVWISALILRRPARPLYQARLLCLRYSTRFVAYAFMLTPSQPFAGLFGDKASPESPTTDGLSTRINPTRWARRYLVASLLIGTYGGVLYTQHVGNLQNILNNAVVVPLVNTTETNVAAALDTFATSYLACAVQSSVVCGTNAAVGARDAIAPQIANLSAGENLVVAAKSEFLAYVAGLRKVNADFSLIASDTTWAQQRSHILTVLRPDISALEAQYQQLRAAL